MQYTLLIHGGAGNVSRERIGQEEEARYRAVLESALLAGEGILKEGKSALDAVETAVRVLEDSPLFNAGKGSVFTADGKQEMDACIMDGRDCNAGGVTAVTHLKNPVSAARLVLEHSSHVLLTGEGAEDWCREQGAEWEEPAYFFDQHRWDQLQEAKKAGITQLDFAEDKPEPDKYGTVGAVALDSHGNLAAATSTGGMTNKLPGRVGDTPIVGAGCYADNATCAVSCTGQGEYFIRGLIARDVSAQMEYGHAAFSSAAEEAIHTVLAKLEGKGGLIAVDAKGNFAMPFNTNGMFRGVVKAGERPQVSMFGQ